MGKIDSCDVVLVGAAHMDLQVRPVGKGLLDTASYPADEMVWSVGGDALNEATIISRLGHRVRLVSCIGDDMIGGMIVDHCNRNGIDTTYLKRDKNKVTGINIGLICEDGERTFINNRSGSIWTFNPNDVDLNVVTEAKILCFASIFNNPLLDGKFMLRLFQHAKQQGMTICADIVGAKRSETLDDIMESLPYIDYFFPNYEEACKLTGLTNIYEIADRLIGLGVGHLLLKIGKKGCLVKTKDRCFIVPGYPASNCVDTTGAGDNFASGFICGLLERKDLRYCAELANCTASIAVETVGATEGVKNREQVEERYQKYLEFQH